MSAACVLIDFHSAVVLDLAETEDMPTPSSFLFSSRLLPLPRTQMHPSKNHTQSIAQESCLTSTRFR
jgi:hypothetical protein